MKYQVQKMLKNSYWDVLHLVKKRRAERDTYLLLSKKMGSFMEILPIQHYRFFEENLYHC